MNQLITTTDILPDEVGVLDQTYHVGDLRRYGALADVAFNVGNFQNAVLSCFLCEAIMVVPAGLYKGEFEITRSNMTILFQEGAEIGGILHVIGEIDGNTLLTPIENIELQGTVVLYDRFGTINVRGLTADKIVLKSDRSKSFYGTPGRGAHIYMGSQNFRIRRLVVEDTGEQGDGEALASTHAALALDSLISNTRPQNIHIDNVLIHRTRVHGAYITGAGHKFGKIDVRDWGGYPLTSQLLGATLEESVIPKQIWVNEGSVDIGANW